MPVILRPVMVKISLQAMPVFRFTTVGSIRRTATVAALMVCGDPDDNKFVEAAVALDARMIVSGDNHLKSLKRYADILILPPKDFVNQFV